MGAQVWTIFSGPDTYGRSRRIPLGVRSPHVTAGAQQHREVPHALSLMSTHVPMSASATLGGAARHMMTQWCTVHCNNNIHLRTLSTSRVQQSKTDGVILYSACSHMSPRSRFLRKSPSVDYSGIRGSNYDTHKTSGASLSHVVPPTISRVQTSRINQATWPTAQPMRSPAAARHVPLSIHARPTSAKGRYGAVMVIRPNSDIGVDGCRRDQM